MNGMIGTRLALFLVLIAFAQAGCNTTSPPPGPAESAGREVDRALGVAASETDRALDVAARETGRALNIAQRETGRALDVAGREVGNVAGETGEFLQQLGKNLSEGTFW